MITVETLEKIRLFNGVPEEHLVAIKDMLRSQTFAKGDTIILENTNSDEMFILTEGKVIVTKELIKIAETVESREKVLATLSSDIFPTFGENGLLGSAPRTANVIANSDCTIYILNKTDYERFADQYLSSAYKIMINIASTLSQRLHDTDINLVKLATAFYIAVQR
ncbi:MAG: cyclic nucleotide-binding domain-containing protein [Candidatus Cloacimonetes bacterium HGW-Cloacimonetes-1]|jgi:CRP-like cAMP-binding protein|nr:MAG: cyclic nucleotide-binding domain-containing protein [Candidatus Cloacimonetes bacterium HGW-Cloacimonetes-1]